MNCKNGIVLLFMSILVAACEKESLNVDFSISNDFVLVGEEVEFRNKSELADSYEWFFGDGERSEKEDATHAYSDTGKYIVSLAAYQGRRTGLAYAVVIVGSNYTRALLSIVEANTGNPVADCLVQLYTSPEDLNAESNVVAETHTNQDGIASFTHIPIGTYYIRVYKEMGGDLWNNGNLDKEITLSGFSNNSFELETYKNPFQLIFNNPVYTPIEITSNNTTQSVSPDESTTFYFWENPGVVSYYAETQVTTTSGDPVGHLVSWSSQTEPPIDVSGLREYTIDLNIGSDVFYMTMQNNSWYNLSPITIYSDLYYYEMIENIVIPNDNVLYSMGYYPAYSDINIDANYEGDDYASLNWENGWEFSLPGTENQYLLLHTDDAWEYKKRTASKKIRIQATTRNNLTPVPGAPLPGIYK